VRSKTLLAEGFSVKGAARKLNLPRSSARYFIDKPGRLAKPPGAPPKISYEQVQEIITWFTRHYDRRILSLKQIREQFPLNCADITLLRAFERYGYHYHVPDCKPFISKANKLKR
jgi:transposase